MKNGAVRRGLKEAHGFRLLHERTGRNITLFYLHDGALNVLATRFTREFMNALGVLGQVRPPCLVFFRVFREQIEDVWIYKIDDQTKDPVLVLAELEEYVSKALERLNSEGISPAVADLGKAIAHISTAVKLGVLVWRPKALAPG